MKKINIKRNEFVRVLSDGGVFAGRNRAMAALNNVRVTTHQGRIRVESSSNDNYIKVYGVCLEETEDMSFCVSPKELTSYLNLIDDEDVKITFDEEKSMLRVKHSHGTMRTPTYDSKDFPVMQIGDAESKHTLPAQILASWLNTAQQFVLTKNFGTALGGVNLRKDNGNLIAVGADGGLVYMSDCPMKGDESFNVIIPKDGAKVMAAMCANTDEVVLSLYNNALVVNNDDFSLYVKLIDIKYPHLNRLFGLKGQTRFSVNAQAFKQAARRVNAQTVVEERRVKVFFKENELIMSYDYPQAGKNVEESIPCECQAFEVAVTINIDYLLMVLTNYVGEEVVFFHSDNERNPFFFEAEGNGYNTTFLLATMV